MLLSTDSSTGISKLPPMEEATTAYLCPLMLLRVIISWSILISTALIRRSSDWPHNAQSIARWLCFCRFLLCWTSTSGWLSLIWRARRRSSFLTPFQKSNCLGFNAFFSLLLLLDALLKQCSSSVMSYVKHRDSPLLSLVLQRSAPMQLVVINMCSNAVFLLWDIVLRAISSACA